MLVFIGIFGGSLITTSENTQKARGKTKKSRPSGLKFSNDRSWIDFFDQTHFYRAPQIEAPGPHHGGKRPL